MTELLCSTAGTFPGTATSLADFMTLPLPTFQLPNLFMLASAVNDLRQKLGEVLIIIMLFAFLIGTIRIIDGANKIRRGETEEGKNAIQSGALIAAAPLIMKILYENFFNGNAVIFGG